MLDLMQGFRREGKEANRPIVYDEDVDAKVLFEDQCQDGTAACFGDGVQILSNNNNILGQLTHGPDPSDPKLSRACTMLTR